jgi:type III secretory pathway component EscT
MLKRILFTTTVLSGALLIVMLNALSPSETGPFGILVVFVLAYFFFVGGFSYLIHSLSSFWQNIVLSGSKKQPLSLRKSYYYSTVFALAPVMLLGMQSVGYLGPYELILVAIFVSVAYVYVSKRVR